MPAVERGNVTQGVQQRVRSRHGRAVPDRKSLQKESNQDLLLRAVKKKHIKLPQGSSIVLDEKEGFIRVTTTRDARAEFDRFIREIAEAK